MLWDLTEKFVSSDGKEVDINDETDVPKELLEGDEKDVRDSYLGILKRQVKQFGNISYRTIMITYRDMSLFEYLDLKDGNGGFRTPRSRGVLEQKLTALGIFGLQDPLRPGIAESV